MTGKAGSLIKLLTDFQLLFRSGKLLTIGRSHLSDLLISYRNLGGLGLICCSLSLIGPVLTGLGIVRASSISHINHGPLDLEIIQRGIAPLGGHGALAVQGHLEQSLVTGLYIRCPLTLITKFGCTGYAICMTGGTGHIVYFLTSFQLARLLNHRKSEPGNGLYTLDHGLVVQLSCCPTLSQFIGGIFQNKNQRPYGNEKSKDGSQKDPQGMFNGA